MEKLEESSQEKEEQQFSQQRKTSIISENENLSAQVTSKEIQSSDSKKQSPIIKEFFDEDRSLTSSVEPFSPKSKLSPESDSESEQLLKKDAQKLKSYAYEKEENIQYSIALDNILKKKDTRLNIDKISTNNIVRNLNKYREDIFLKNNIRFVTTEFLKNLIENI